MEGRDYKYSVLKLIELVKVRPVLWDSTRVEYRSYKNKDKAWQEVFQEIDEDYLSMGDKDRSITAMKITTKWRNIRDVFIRSLKKGATDKKMRKYIYHDHLSFMLKLYTPYLETESSEQSSYLKPAYITENSLKYDRGMTFDFLPEESAEEYVPYIKNEPEDEELANESFQECQSVKKNNKNWGDENENTSSTEDQFLYVENETVKQKKRKRSYIRSVAKPNTVGSTGKCTLMQHDDDEAFMVSILSLLRDMSVDEKLEFRTATLQKITDIRSKRHNNTHYSTIQEKSSS